MRKFLRKVATFVKQPWFLLLVATVVLCLAVWFAGPLIGTATFRPLAGPAARLAALLVIVALWGVANLFVRLRRVQLNEALIEEFKRRQTEEKEAEAKADEAAQEELATIRQQAEDALKLLRTARFDRIFRRRYLYELPWYLVIGPPASGKTTALLNAGLTFPLSGELQTPAVPGIAGTRNCDWWLADEAVLIDTAGRYTTRESDALVDGKVWSGLLDLLKARRARQPLNGVLVVVSLVELASVPEQERAALARALRQRLGELRQQLRLRFPIYLLFSKLDLVLGFDEFFETIGREDRGQVWGMTFPTAEPRDRRNIIDRFDNAFTDLLAGLERRVLRRLQEEPDLRRRAHILEFPAQVALLQPVAHAFLDTVFKPSVYEEPLLLRGVYLASSTQEGAPADLLEPAMAPSFGLAATAAAASPKSSFGTRSYFLRRVFHDVIIAEAGLVGLDRVAERWRRLGGAALAAGISATAGLVLALWLHSYQANRAAMERDVTVANDVDRDVGVLPQPSADAAGLRAVIPPLDALRALPGGFAAQHGETAALAPLALYNAKPLSAQATAAYVKGLRGLLLPRLLARLETQLRAPNAKPTYLYQALKTYLMLSGHGPLDADFVLAWLKLDWSSALAGPDDATAREHLARHAAALLTVLPGPVPIDEPLVSSIRARLTVATLAQRGYELIQGLPIAEQLPKWRVIDHAGPAASRVLLRPSGRSLWDGVDGLYTRAGFFEVFLPASAKLAESLAKEGWVLGDSPADAAQPLAAKRLRDDMLALYLDDYIRAWDRLLADIAITPFHSAEHAADVLNVLAGPNSPLKKLLQGISHETNLDPPPATAAAGGKLVAGANPAEQAAAQAVQGANGVQQLAHLASLTAAVAPAPGHPVTLHFADLHDFADPQDGAPAPLDGVVKSLGTLYGVFNRLSAGATLASAAVGAGGTAPDAAVADLRATAARLPAPFNQLFGAVAASGGSIVSGSARDYFTKIWRSTVLPHCEQAVEGRFPFVANAADETPVDDFAQLFGPEGEIAKFFNTYLKPFANTDVTPWRWQKADGVDLGLGPDVLAQFERASDLGAAFFPAGAKRPSASFEIAPLLVDPRVTTLRLVVDGQVLQYQHGPLTPLAMQWPSPQGPAGASLSFVPSPAGTAGSLSAPGPWGFLRLLSAARVTRIAPDRYRLDFTLGGRTATLTLKASGLHNPFDLQLAQQFRCPAW